MSLPQILYPSPTDRGLDEFVHANWQHHQAINKALQNAYGIPFQAYIIFPLARGNEKSWLEQHARWHSDMCAATGVQSTDLSTVNFDNQKERDAWYFLHYKEHEAIAQKLGITT
jgi:hypothetical protein